MLQLINEDRCPNCLGRHGIWPLEHLQPNKICTHDPTLPCIICGHPVGGLSMGGSNICGWCDCHGERPDLYLLDYLFEPPYNINFNVDSLPVAGNP